MSDAFEIIGALTLLATGGILYLLFLQEIRSMKDEGEL